MGMQERAARLQESPEAILAHAVRLAEADEDFLYELVKARKDSGLSQRDVAEILGIKQSSVAAFERHDNDPRLSTIRRYALAIGAFVDHHISAEAADVKWYPVPAHFSVGAQSWSGQHRRDAPTLAHCAEGFSVAA